LAAGSSEGHLIVINAETGSTMLTLRVCGSPLNCLEYNQIGDMVAIGSQNGNLASPLHFYELICNANTSLSLFLSLSLIMHSQDQFICLEFHAMDFRTRESTKFVDLSH
jgi:hypothetical protein